ncbi:hypothetical protein [Mycolicibacterium aromaticivorans]|uniref:hypothetical protein n=1 Tax=Mycolicibacterium aromaticivorans TaxID=318425 RepID=UPI00103F67FE|nr:hypothetical protein [Mycolicibacterium aromaticivorans]
MKSTVMAFPSPCFARATLAGVDCATLTAAVDCDACGCGCADEHPEAIAHTAALAAPTRSQTNAATNSPGLSPCAAALFGDDHRAQRTP